jgi:hypothetical protein
MLRLKINLRVRRSVRVKCPRHPATTQSVTVQVPSVEAAATAWPCTSYMRASLRSSGPCKRWSSRSRGVRRSMSQLSV